MQRNASTQFIDPDDKDIVIVSDVDEILDSRRADEVIWAVQKYDIVTVKLRLSHFFFDLLVDWWPGPEDYAYRTFIMTGRYFRTLKGRADRLRKAGESGALIGKVHCLSGFAGFHHSWIGDVDALVRKISAYSHDPEEHAAELRDEHGAIRVAGVKQFLESHRCLFDGSRLRACTDLPMLSSVDMLHDRMSRFLLRKSVPHSEG